MPPSLLYMQRLEHEDHIPLLDKQPPNGLRAARPGQRDFSNVAKADVHIHLAAAMSQQKLVKAVKTALTVEPAPLEIAAIKAQGFSSNTITLDVLDMFSHDVFNRFDLFDKSCEMVVGLILCLVRPTSVLRPPR